MNIKISLMLLLQVMVVAIFKLTDRISDSQDIIDVTLARLILGISDVYYMVELN